MSKACRIPFSKGSTLLLLLLFILPGNLAAQGSEVPSLEEVGARIEAILPDVEAAGRTAFLADSLIQDSIHRASFLPLDTIQVGPFRVITILGQGELAEEVFEEAWRDFRPLIRGSESTIADQTFTFRYGWKVGTINVDGEDFWPIEASPRFGSARMRGEVRNGIGRAIIRGLPTDSTSLVFWSGGAPLSLNRDWSWVYRELASSGSNAARRCFQGDLPRCWEAMGISETEGGWMTWYTPEERRLLVRSQFERQLARPGPILSRSELLVHGCAVLRSDRACIEVLELWPGRIPLGPYARAAIVTEALTLGGEGAFARLTADPSSPIKVMLSAASQLPPDTLVARWRDKAMAAQPNVQAGLLLSPLSLAVWLLALLFLATRSTRWRLG